MAEEERAEPCTQIVPSPDGKFILAQILGTDGVFIYRYLPGEDPNKVLTFVNEIKVKKASGPRHMTFDKNGHFLYLLQELSAELTVFSVNKEGELTPIQETTIIIDGTKKNSAADIHLSPDGKFLYTTNRGESNTITCFKVSNDGMLEFVEQYSTYGNTPRNFAVTPDGKFLFIGNQQTNNITIFSRNKSDGKLNLISSNTKLGAPVCLLFY